jgi:hypothetical protein
MSHVYYDTKWQQAVEELTELVNIENPPPEDASAAPVCRYLLLIFTLLRLPSRERLTHFFRDVPALLQPAPRIITPEEAFRHFCFLYVKYVQVFRKLEDAYDQIVQPQKRADIKFNLESVCAHALAVHRVCCQYAFAHLILSRFELARSIARSWRAPCSSSTRLCDSIRAAKPILFHSTICSSISNSRPRIWSSRFPIIFARYSLHGCALLLVLKPPLH